MREKQSTKKPSRRQMLAASGATVAAISAANTGYANGRSKIEISTWKELIGTSFRIGRKGSSAKLVAVQQMKFDDPHRPKEMRSPFILFFCPEKKGELLDDGIYDLYSRRVRLKSMFLSATLVADLSPRPIYHAVFA